MKAKKENSPVSLSDEQIVERILKGEKHLYENLMRKYDKRLYRISMSIINDEAEAEDIIQTSFLNAYMQLPAFQYKSSFSTWLTRILINESLLRKKKRIKQRQLVSRKPAANNESETPLKKLLNKEMKALLEKAISDLPEKYKVVFIMREIEEMSTSETMEVLNISEANVKVRLSRAKEMLRENLAGEKLKDVFQLQLPVCDKIVDYVMDKINESGAV